MSTHPSDAELARGNGALVADPPPVIDKDGRATLFAFRARMQEGREEMLRYLGSLGSGPKGFAERLHACLSSTDQRVVLGALRLAAQLREWVGSDIDQAPAHGRVLLLAPEDLRAMLGMKAAREQVVDALEVLVTTPEKAA